MSAWSWPDQVPPVTCELVHHDADAGPIRPGTAGHVDAVRTADELWNNEVAEPVAGGWPELEIDTSRPVALAKVLAFVRRSYT